MDTKFANKYFPDHVKSETKWYERDVLITYIDQLKYSEFIKNPDDY